MTILENYSANQDHQTSNNLSKQTPAGIQDEYLLIQRENSYSEARTSKNQTSTLEAHRFNDTIKNENDQVQANDTGDVLLDPSLTPPLPFIDINISPT